MREELDPYTDPDAILALYTNPEDEVTLVSYLADAAFIQMGLMPASGLVAAVPNTPTSTGTQEEILEIGGELPGGGGDPFEGPKFKRSPLLDQDLNPELAQQ